MDQIQKLSNVGSAHQAFDFIAHLGDHDRVVGALVKQGQSREQAEHIFQSMGQDKRLQEFLVVDRDVESEVSTWGGVPDVNRMVAMARKLEPTVGHGNARAIALEVAKRAQSGAKPNELATTARDMVMSAIGAQVSGKSSPEDKVAPAEGKDGQQATQTLGAMKETYEKLGNVLKDLAGVIPHTT
jgi:hypothetical protein